MAVRRRRLGSGAGAGLGVGLGVGFGFGSAWATVSVTTLPGLPARSPPGDCARMVPGAAAAVRRSVVRHRRPAPDSAARACATDSPTTSGTATGCGAALVVGGGVVGGAVVGGADVVGATVSTSATGAALPAAIAPHPAASSTAPAIAATRTAPIGRIRAARGPAIARLMLSCSPIACRPARDR